MKFKSRPGRLRRAIKPRPQPKPQPFASAAWGCIQWLSKPVRYLWCRTPSQVMERLIEKVKNARHAYLEFEIRKQSKRQMERNSRRAMESVKGV